MGGVMMAEALVNPSVLLWARDRARMEPSLVADKIHVKTDRLLDWEKGTARPTFKQAEDLANVLYIPFGFLFLPSPPKESLPIPDLRTVQNRAIGWLSPDLREVLADVLRKQDWYREYLLDQDAGPVPFIGRFTRNDLVVDIAADITKTLNLTVADRDYAKNWEEFLNLLTERAEDANVWVMRSGIVGSNTHRRLEVDEFRGFAVCDEIAPVVFINGRDVKVAQAFTLMHELAHLWLGTSGISDFSIAHPSDVDQNQIERKCNAVAAEVLVPAVLLREHWNRLSPIADNADSLSAYFRVSKVVVARRAYDLKLIRWETYDAFYQTEVERWRKKTQSNDGGNTYDTLPVRNGQRFTSAVLQSALEHTLLLRDAGKLLGLSPSKIIPFARKKASDERTLPA
jgi:Zn-dependent peptidase ImmA (M78 family)/transcriptional regulator with XRE-family HTH domain